MKIILKNGSLVNEGRNFNATIIIEGDKILEILEGDNDLENVEGKVYDLEGKIVLPGIIDTHVHFREPGLTHKADFYTESLAALAGGVTTIFDMPNVKPPTVNMELVNERIRLAEKKIKVNYAFYVAATNNNLEELKKVDYSIVPGIKVFMGSSTGNMLVDNKGVLKKLFSLGRLIAVHAEDEEIIVNNLSNLKKKYGEDIPIELHSKIRSRDACIKATKEAIKLAEIEKARLHLLHISTAEEAELITQAKSLNNNLSAEVVINHLFFDETMYKEKGIFIKFNPSVKLKSDREALLDALKRGGIDTVATDHAPHTKEEKNNNYINSPSGVPMIQHSLLAMIELSKENKISLAHIADFMSHNPARIFGIKNRGFIRKGYFADLTIVDTTKTTKVSKENLFYKCRWSPFEGKFFSSSVYMTIVNGCIAYEDGNFNDCNNAMLVNFEK